MQQWAYTWFICSEDGFCGDKQKYKVFDGKNGEEYLAYLGDLGWELVAAVPIADDSKLPGYSTYIKYIFKKPDAGKRADA